MIYYCDTEFTKFNGELLSLALVPQDERLPNFYVQTLYSGDVDPWVVDNVLPHMEDEWVTLEQASQRLLKYLGVNRDPTIIADWPEDLSYFLKLMIVGPGQMLAMDNVKTVLKRTRNWNSADHSKVPHHALHDAIAIRAFWKDVNTRNSWEPTPRQ